MGTTPQILLSDALLTLLRAGPPADEREARERLALIVDHIRPRGRAERERGGPRLREVLRQLADDALVRASFRALIRTLLSSTSHRMLYATAGITRGEGLLGGLGRRLVGRLLPPAVDEGVLGDVLMHVFDEAGDHEWLETLDEADWKLLFDAVGVDEAEFEPIERHVRNELLESLHLISVQLAALGADATLVRYLPALARRESPFLAQSEEVRVFLNDAPTLAVAGSAAAALDARQIQVLLSQCSEYAAQVRRRSHEAGVSVDLVYLLARIEDSIERMQLLLGLACAPSAPAPAERREAIARFIVLLVRAEGRRYSLRDQFVGALQLVARRVTEHASRSGEHYISSNRAQFLHMFRAASGAGLIIAAMALNKILLSGLELPLAWAALAYSLNYGLGFVLVHLCGFTIATKQPAVTAATLASAVDPNESREERIDALTSLAAEVSRTQWISIVGNVAVGFTTALAIALGLHALGVNPVSADKGDHLLRELDPVRSLALLHAAIAGVYLFFSGLISGYFDNLCIYHRVPDRVRRLRRLARYIGAARVDALARYVEHNLGALVGNFLFGCLLGSTGVVGKLLGLPLDIRHVAFASANLAYGLEAQEFGVVWQVAVNSAFGVACIGAVNLAVSFALALRTALYSREVDPGQTSGLIGSIFRRFLVGPRAFFLPPRERRSGPGHS
jgi:site-specific recombinase